MLCVCSEKVCLVNLCILKRKKQILGNFDENILYLYLADNNSKTIGRELVKKPGRSSLNKKTV